MGRKDLTSFPNKGQREGIKCQSQQRGMQAQPLGILFTCYPYPNPTKTRGECKNPRAVDSQGDLGHPHLTIRQSSSKNEQNPGGETPGEKELGHLLPVQGQPWVPVKCCLFELSGTRRSRCQTWKSSELIPPAGGSELPVELRDGEGAAGGTAREVVRVVFTRRGFSTAEVPAGICQAALPGKAAEVSLRVCLSLHLPARLLPPDPGPRHALKAD